MLKYLERAGQTLLVLVETHPTSRLPQTCYIIFRTALSRKGSWHAILFGDEQAYQA